MSSPHFTLYSHVGGPNPWSVAFVLKALGLEYETKYLEFDKGQHKSPDFLAFNPNGRLPALVDHKAGISVWESKACMMYLVEHYDPQHTISVVDPRDRVETLTYLFFQASGQGPYFGQAYHFKMSHRDKIPYAIERYENETKRVFGVLEAILATKASGWLVAGKPTIADLAHITWNFYGSKMLLPDGTDFKKEFPLVSDWQDRMMELDYVKQVFADKEEAGKKFGH